MPRSDYMKVHGLPESNRKLFVRTFFQWFALILPILFVLLPHKVMHIFSCALTSFSLPRFFNFRHIRDLLIQFQVPEDYPWEWHQRQSVVYLRVSMTTTLKSVRVYIGATSDTVQRRESARRRKFIQLARKKLSHYEPNVIFIKVFSLLCIMSWTDSHC